MAVVQLLFIACSYAAVLAVIPDARNPSVVRWAVTTSALVVAGAMIGLLKDRVDRLIRALGEAAHTDTVTGLLNRRAFVDTLEMELERARRGHVNVGLIAVHLYWQRGGGHSALADRALEMAGAAVRRAVRRIDVAARTGDRTFAVIVPYASDHGAYVLAERIQNEVVDGVAGVLGDSEIEVAVGVASFPEHASTVEELRHGADQAVTAARRLGPNRVVAFSPDQALAAK
jgi:diguanylate cyclase (GGDEF)-like protein